MALPEAPRPNWTPVRPSAPPPRIWVAEADDDDAEGDGIAAEVRRRVAAGVTFRDQAVLVRTHAQAGPIVAALARAGVPVLYVGDLFGRDEIRDVLALMALAAEGEGTAILRLGAMPEHFVPRADRILVLRHAREHGLAFPAALRLAAQAGVSAPAAGALDDLATTLGDANPQGSPWHFLARYLFGHGRLVRRLLRESSADAAQQLMALSQLMVIARAFVHRPPRETIDEGNSLQTFLGHVRRLAALGERGVSMPTHGEGIDAVRVLTVHASKGLEFPVVYLTNLADQRFPCRDLPDAAPPPPGLVEDTAEDTPADESCLFFVAISRAKDELVLSRARRYGKKNYKPSPLLDLVAPFFADHLPARLQWTAGRMDISATAADDVTIGDMLNIAEVELYMSCPRRYLYRYQLGFAESGEASGYKQCLDCLRAAMRQIAAGYAEATVTDHAAAQAVLAATWDRSGFAGHPHEALYRPLAEEAIARYWSDIKQQSSARTWREQVDVPVAGMTVRVPIDASTVSEGGHIRIVRRRIGMARDGKARDKDRKAPRLALLRAAAANQAGAAASISIALEYWPSGTTVLVKDAGRWEKERIQSLEQAVAELRAGCFPPEPADKRACATCPYWIVCPA